jgi:glycosyltransferase involved in cell wall biosynthesis
VSGDDHKRRRIERWEQHADLIYSLNPDLLHVLPSRARFLPYASVDPRRWQPVVSSNDVPLVVHAPTHAGIKGTRFVVESVERLREQGVRFEFALIQGMTREEARQTYERADIVVDQLLLGWYGGLAVEAMALGKPVIAYIRREDLRFVPDGLSAELPVISAEPTTVYDVLFDLITAGRERREEIGLRSRAFAERWHDPVRIAREVADDYRSTVEATGG